MAIGATQHNMRSLMHRLDAAMALIAADALGIGRGDRLVDPVLRGARSGLGGGKILRDGSRRAVAGGRKILGGEESGAEEREEKETPNAQRPTPNA